MLENLYKDLITEVKGGNRCIMLTYLDFQNERHGKITGKALYTSEDIAKRIFPIDDDIYEQICIALDTGMLKAIKRQENNTILIEPFTPTPRLIVFGGGHIAVPLIEFATKVGFSVTVIDDRPYFANATRFALADRVICESFENSIKLINLRKTDFVVIITRGHKYDGVVLRKVLNHEISYIGMIGSKRRVQSMWDELISEGCSRDKLNSVHAPIGMDISAITPNEIAISIVSQLISCKNKSIIDRFGKAFSFPEFDIEVAERISEKSPLPKALITVISTKGSVPRKAGSKMVAYIDGRTYGSIGGGCSESKIISNARTMMLQKGFMIEHLDLTGNMAEDEGMVCGGLMDVLVEVF